MNCKLGDLAILMSGNIPGGDPYAGRFVEVVRHVPDDWFYGPLWSVKPLGWAQPEHDQSDSGCFHYLDSLMRPIRDQPGEDEILRIAGRPTELPAPAVIAENAL